MGTIDDFLTEERQNRPRTVIEFPGGEIYNARILRQEEACRGRTAHALGIAPETLMQAFDALPDGALGGPELADTLGVTQDALQSALFMGLGSDRRLWTVHRADDPRPGG